MSILSYTHVSLAQPLLLKSIRSHRWSLSEHIATNKEDGVHLRRDGSQAQHLHAQCGMSKPLRSQSSYPLKSMAETTDEAAKPLRVFPRRLWEGEHNKVNTSANQLKAVKPWKRS
jgi:hypothetical protein